MSDRLAELRRQRALVQEHLAWLDRELAQLQQNTPAAPAAPLSPAAEPPRVFTPPSATAASLPLAALSSHSPALAHADAILAEYRVEPNALKSDVRKGCFLYFAAALLLFALGVVGLWWAFRK